MNWFWKVRIYRLDGYYWFSQIKTSRNLHDIDLIKDFYENFTDCKMLLEGMSETEYAGVSSIKEAFYGLWKPNNAHNQ